MSARTNLARSNFERGAMDPDTFRSDVTPDITLLIPAAGIDLRGVDAVADFIADFGKKFQPTYVIELGPIEHGDFVVTFVEFRARGKVTHVAELWRFEGDKVAGIISQLGS